MTHQGEVAAEGKMSLVVLVSLQHVTDMLQQQRP